MKGSGQRICNEGRVSLGNRDIGAFWRAFRFGLVRSYVSQTYH